MRVVVADDSMLIREGLTTLLRQVGVTVVGKASNADELLRSVALSQPDVAVVDVRMPPGQSDEGVVAAERIRDEHPNVGVLLLSHYVDSRYATRLLAEHPGRLGYLLKERVSDMAVLIDALERIAAGECVIDPTIVAGLVRRPRPAQALAVLSNREREVLALMAEGALQPGHRRAARTERQDRREPRAADLREAGPARHERPTPPRARGPALSAQLSRQLQGTP